MGNAGILLGAGRRFQTDVLDPSAGIEVFAKQGEMVFAGEPLFRLYAKDDARSGLPCAY